MINFRIIARVFSLLLILEGVCMLITALISLIYNESTTSVFIYSGIITIITGIIVFTPLRKEEKIYRNKEGYIIATGAWVIFSLFGTLPFILSGSTDSFTDAFFESMSGFTTTGATIMTNIENLPNGILFWRSFSQWLGGIGIIIISLSIFPIVKSINVQLASTEFTGQSKDKIHPRTKDTAKRFVGIFIIITVLQIFFLVAGGMTLFDATCHSFSTMSSGGFTNSNRGIEAFATPYIMIITTLFMFIAGTNMTLIYFGFKGNFKKIIGNNEFVFYSILCLLFIIIGSLLLITKDGFTAGNAIINGAFHITSIITTTGFYTKDYFQWNNLLVIILFILMFTGGTAGSTSGSIKMARIMIIAKAIRQEIKKMVHPNAFIPVRIDKHIIPQPIIYNIMVFIVLYILIVCLGSIFISLMGYDLITSFSVSASFLGNIGPAMGNFAPFTTYSSLPVTGKWFLSVLMLLGRLELITVILLFTRGFYRN